MTNIWELFSEKIGDKTIDERITIAGIPLSWVIRRYLGSYVIPKPLNFYPWISKKMPKFKQYQMQIASILLKYYIKFNEQYKLIKGKKPDFTDNPKILFLTYPQHMMDKKIFRIQGVIDCLNKDNEIKPFPLFVTPLSEIKIGTENNIYQYINKTIKKKSIIQAKETWKKWCNIKKLIKKREEWKVIRFSLSLFISKQFLYLIYLYYNTFKEIIIKQNLKAVVLTASNGIFEKCILLAAKEMNIPCFIIPHGLRITINPEIIGKTYYLVMNESVKYHLEKKGVSAEQIYITGPVIFDDIFANKYKKIKRKKQILIATAPLYSNALSICDYKNKLIDIIKKIPEYNIIFKMHPREKDKGFYKNILKICKVKGMILDNRCSRNNFYNYIQESQLFLHFGSTSALEAMILNIPVITVNMFDHDNQERFEETKWFEDATEMVSYKGDIRKAIQNAEHNFLKQQEFLKKNYKHIDGKASQRAADFIINVISNAHK